MVLKNKLVDLLCVLTSRVIPSDREATGEQSSDRELVELMDEARRNWLAARAFFNNVTEPDLIDQAIYTMNAAERRYIYLWKKARQMGYSINVSKKYDLSEEVK